MDPQHTEHASTTLSLRVPVPDDAPHHFSGRTLLLGDDILLASWVEGRASARLGILDLRTGMWRVATGLRGMLRDALDLPDNRALLLDDYGLREIDLDSLEIARTLTAKIGKHNDFLHREDDDTVAVGNIASAMESLVSLTTLSVLRRRRQPARPHMPLAAAAAHAGVARLFHQDAALLVGATDARASAPQRLLVLSAEDHSVLASAEFPCGLGDAHPVHDGVVAAAPDLGRVRELTAVLGLRPLRHDAPPLRELTSLASESATSILQTRARRNPPRMVIRGQRLEPGAELTDVQAQRMTLEDCRIARADAPDARPRIRRVQVKDLELRSSTPSGAVIEDVTVDGLRCPHGSGFFFGVEFRRVTLRGRIHGLILNPGMHHLDEASNARYAQWYQKRLQDPEWMLDLTEATGDITIRGYPSRFIRRNPELQVVVTAEDAIAHDWQTVDPGGSSLRVTMRQLLESDWEDVTLIANSHGPEADKDLRYLRALRDRGVARPD